MAQRSRMTENSRPSQTALSDARAQNRGMQRMRERGRCYRKVLLPEVLGALGRASGAGAAPIMQFRAVGIEDRAGDLMPDVAQALAKPVARPVAAGASRPRLGRSRLVGDVLQSGRVSGGHGRNSGYEVWAIPCCVVVQRRTRSIR